MTLAGGDQLDLLAGLGVPSPPTEPAADPAPPALVDDEGLAARRERAARIAFKARQATMLAEIEAPERVRLPVLVPNSDLCGQPTTCRRISCPWNTTLDVGEPEEVDGKIWRRVVLNTGWREGAEPELGRRPAYNVEEQADARTWIAFGAEVEAELDDMEGARFPNCSDRFAKRVRAAVEEAEDTAEDRAAALRALDDTTMVAIGKILGVSDESARLSCRSAEEKLRNMARDGGYSQDGDVSDLAEAILFGASE
jgi:hypothetical protein